jgi:pilus assembly protein CpaE
VDSSRPRQVIVLTRDEELQKRVAGALASNAGYHLLQRVGNVEAIYSLGAQGALDLILLDYRLHPEDPLVPVKDLSQRLPEVPLTVLTGPQEADYIRRALLAGAKTFLPLQFAPESLIQTIDDLTAGKGWTNGGGARGRIITAFSLKGGVGRTMVASNLAVALREETKAPVVLVDGEAAFGDVEIALNLKPQHTVAELVAQVDTLEPEVLDHALARHASGLRVLAAPGSAKAAERVQPRHLTAILRVLRGYYPWVVVDGGHWADPRTEAVLEASDVVLLVTTPDLSSLRATRVFLEMAREHQYPEDKVRLVINRFDMPAGIPEKHLRKLLAIEPFALLADDPSLVAHSINRGVPLVQSHGRKPLAKVLRQMAHELAGETASRSVAAPRRGLFGLARG